MCHTDAYIVPHKELKKVDPEYCSTCHAGAAREYLTSVHGKALVSGMGDVANCADCHGSHDILAKNDPNSQVFPFNLPQTCGKCHSSEKLAAEHNIPVPEAYQTYMKSVHGRGLLLSGLLFSATCNDCHGVHDIKDNRDPESKLHHSNVPTTCGRCHLGILEEYKESIHGRGWQESTEGASPKSPVCTDCHRTHEIPEPLAKEFQLSSIRACGGCHEESFETYKESYHGKVTTLGYTGVAKCSDCHGAHKILPPTEEASTLSSKNIVRTCQACHPAANANFATFLPHADPRQKAEYPVLYFVWLFMTLLLIGVFGIFGLHTMLWAIRGTTERLLVKAKSEGGASDDEGA